MVYGNKKIQGLKVDKTDFKFAFLPITSNLMILTNSQKTKYMVNINPFYIPLLGTGLLYNKAILHHAN